MQSLGANLGMGVWLERLMLWPHELLDTHFQMYTLSPVVLHQKTIFLLNSEH